MTRDPELLSQIQERRWFHTIDLGNGTFTRGDSPASEIISRSLPDCRGKSVLDIGAWDGKYSYEAELAGASRVVALDHYIWKLDIAARQAYYDECEQKGVLPDPDQVASGFLFHDDLPGKTGFDLLHRYFDSKVEAVVDDFMTMDLEALGTFDIVYYFGVLYHMVSPVHALKRLRKVTGEVAVIETAGTYVSGHPNSSLLQFFAGDELHADYGNWFAPSQAALVAMCRAAGFSRVEITAHTDVGKLPRFKAREVHDPVYCRIAARAYV